MKMQDFLSEVRNCTVCEKTLPLGPRPVLSGEKKSKVIIIGQAPGSVVHQSGLPWDDKSGDNLRRWLGVSKEEFYNTQNFAILPMGLCYPGRGKSGDLPPMKVCAPLWHAQVLAHIEDLQMILLIGKYAQDYYLPKEKKRTLTEKVRNFKEFLPMHFVLPHPSPRNNIWQAKNPWFKMEVIPELQDRIGDIL
jgi:uracil-DNA glycosylase family 4